MGRTGQASIHAALDDFTTKLRRRQFPDSSVALARHTTETLIHAVAAQQSPTVEGIIEGVRAVSQKLVDARPLGARSRLSSTVSRLLLSRPPARPSRSLAHASSQTPTTRPRQS
jgi:translation initiation factor 2B subunit (eIF-2B alpha/beta/delta family)